MLIKHSYEIIANFNFKKLYHANFAAFMIALKKVNKISLKGLYFVRNGAG
tara:strand:+ start:182 stop:331 length:150 start_codon:yes stop_codon:yes gene_type:complete